MKRNTLSLLLALITCLGLGTFTGPTNASGYAIFDAPGDSEYWLSFTLDDAESLVDAMYQKTMDEVTQIGNSAFDGCANLTSVIFSNGTVQIDDYAVRGCGDSMVLNAPANSNVQTYCNNNGIRFKAAEGSKISSNHGFEIQNGVLVKYNGSSGAVTVPDGVTEIGDWAFDKCLELTSVTIPNGVIRIGEGAFSTCTNLNSITIPGSVTRIEDYAFDACTSLTNVSIPNSVDYVGAYAFMWCTSLTNVTFFNGKTEIGEFAFFDCSELAVVKAPANGSVQTYCEDYDLHFEAINSSDQSAPAKPVKPSTPTASTASFTDVPTGAYYYDAVLWAVRQGITGGTSIATFDPEKPCTRAEIVTFLWRAAGSPTPKSMVNPFTDVQPGYYYDAVLWAVEQGITTGTSSVTFSPNAAVTRGQTVTFLYRATGSLAAGGSNQFMDVVSNAYYSNAIQWAVSKGITNGTGANTFSPDNDCTRAQIVTFLYRDRAN